MEKDLITYKISDDGEELGMTQVAYTSTPAIITRGMYLSDIQKKYSFKDSIKGILAAPAMIPDMLIYRKDDDLGEYNVTFDKETIDSLRSKFMKTKDKNVFNLDHNQKQQVGDKSYILDSWITGPSETDLSYTRYGVKVPEGSWFVVSQFTDLSFFKKEIVDKDRLGYSIEGMLGLEFKKIEEKIKQNYMKLLKLSEIKKADGGSVWIDGEVAVDSYIYDNVPSIQLIDNKRVEVKYPYWGDNIELADGTILICENGKILEITKKTAVNPITEDVAANKTKEEQMTKQKFSMEKLEDGTPIWISALEVGGEINTIDENMEKAPIFDGTHILSNGSVVSTVDGKITEIKTKEEAMASDAPASADVSAPTDDSKINGLIDTKLEPVLKAIADLKTLIESDVNDSNEIDLKKKDDKYKETKRPSLSLIFKSIK